LDFELKIVADLGEVAATAWNALVPEGACPFLEHGWLVALEETGCVSAEVGWLPQHLTLWQGERLVAAAPAYIKGNSEGEFVFDWGWAEAAERLGVAYYPKMIVGIPFTPATAPKALVHPGLPADQKDALRTLLYKSAQVLARELGCSSLHWLFVPDDEVTQLEALGYGIRHGFQYHWRNPGYGSYDDFLARFTSHRRHGLKRERAEAGRQGLTLEVVPGRELTPELLRVLYRFYAATVDKHMWGRRYLSLELFQRARETFGHRLEAVVARRGGEVIAGALNAASSTTLYGRYWGTDVDLRFLHFNVCFYRSIEECIARGLRTFEPGAGGEHKYERGFEPTLTRSAHWIFDRKLDAPVRSFLGRERHAVQAHLEELSASSPLRPLTAG
jgi:predicted N-acyltransferase